MIKIKAQDEEYDLINDWSDMSIAKFLEVQRICDKAPEKLKKLIGHVYFGEKEQIEKMNFSNREQLKTFPKFYGDILEELSNIPNKVLKTMDFETRVVYFNTHLIKFVIGCLYAPVDVPEITTDKFEFEGETYVLPKSRSVLGNERPMGYISTIQFTESADLDIYMRDLDDKNYSVLPNIVSILCLKEGEEYDEDVCLKRAEEFRQLTMDIAWDVFFYLDELLNMYTKATLSSSLEKVKLSTQASLGRQV